jgi:hypothetical protein
MTREEVKELIREVISEELKIDFEEIYDKYLYNYVRYKVQLKLGENNIISTSKDSIEIPNPNFIGFN